MKWIKRDRLSLKASLFYNSLGLTIYLFLQWSLTVLVVYLSGFENAGKLALCISVTNTFYSIALFGMRNFQISDIEGKYTDAVYLYSRLITCAIALLLCFVFVLIQPYTLEMRVCILVYMLFKSSEAAVDVLHGIDQKIWRMDIVAFSFILRGILSFIGFVSMLYLTKELIVAVLAMAMLSSLIVVFFDAKILRVLVPLRLSFRDLLGHRQDLMELLKKCLPLMLYLFIFSGTLMYPRVLLQQIYGDDLLGIYSSVTTPALIVQLAASFLFNPLVPLMAEQIAQSNISGFRKYHRRSILSILLLGAVMLGLSALIGGYALELLFAKRIVPYTYLLNPVIVIAAFTALIYYLDTILIILRDNLGLSICNLLGLVASVITSHWLVPVYGAQGVNDALLVSLTLLTVLLFSRVHYLIRRKTPLEIVHVQ